MIIEEIGKNHFIIKKGICMIRPTRKADKNYSFFSRMLLLCTILLTTFAIISTLIIGFLSNKNEQTRYLNSYELAIANLSDTFSEREAAFGVLSKKLMDGKQCKPDLCALLEAPDYDKLPADIRRSLLSLLSSLIQDDRYLHGFLLYSNTQKKLYAFTRNNTHLIQAPELPRMPRIVPYTGTRIDLSDVNRLMKACTGSTEGTNRYYGMTATIYVNLTKPLGYLIPLYATSEYENMLAGYNSDADSVFYIQDDKGHTYYKSYPYLPKKKDVQYSHSIRNANLHYKAGYAVMKFKVPKSIVSYLTLLFAVLVTLFSIALYYLTFYLSKKNIHGILSGMHRFSLDDLAYRIPVPKGHNEFTGIAEGFNDMCEKLQKNVERSYVYELQQKKSELYALQTSINPHFLYNTLEIIRNQIQHANNQDATQMLLLLSKIYRSQTDTTMFVSLATELELCENLMILYQYRFLNFDYEVIIDDNAEQYALPKNTLQPLIENYFVHGIDTERQDNQLLLHASVIEKEEKNYVKLCIENNGKPPGDERLAQIRTWLGRDIYQNQTKGFALGNVSGRLRIVFHEDCAIRVDSAPPDVAFRITIIFPCISVAKLKEEF